MNDDFDKEEFLKIIHTLPYWVKNGDDLLKFCKHIHYRLLQQKAMNSWYDKNIKLEEHQDYEVTKIYGAYDHAYEEDKSEFESFEKIFIEK